MKPMFIVRRAQQVLRRLGPGFITGASDDDPSGIATYAQTGAMFGYAQIWTALFTFVPMAIIQEMCGRIGMVTGRGLAGVLRRSAPRGLLWFTVTLLIVANAVNVGADLGAMASAVQLLLPFHFLPILATLTIGTILAEIFIPYRIYARYLKVLAFSLFAYVIAAFIVKQDWTTLAWSVIMPQISLSQTYVMNLVAILGTTISPYLFFWQASEEVEEQVSNGKLRAVGMGIPKITKRDIVHMRADTTIGMLFSNVIMFFIIATAAATLHAHGITEIQTASDAAEALRPLAGDLTFFIFTAGIIGTGLLAVPILAGAAAYAAAESCRWRVGLSRKFWQAPQFYGIIALVTAGGALVNFLPIPPFRLLYIAAVLNGLCAPPLMFIIMKIGNDSSILGRRTNPWWSNLGGGIITAVMTIAGGVLLWQLATGA